MELIRLLFFCASSHAMGLFGQNEAFPLSTNGSPAVSSMLADIKKEMNVQTQLLREIRQAQSGNGQPVQSGTGVPGE
jgi:hypothetical protein